MSGENLISELRYTRASLERTARREGAGGDHGILQLIRLRGNAAEWVELDAAHIRKLKELTDTQEDVISLLSGKIERLEKQERHGDLVGAMEAALKKLGGK